MELDLSVLDDKKPEKNGAVNLDLSVLDNEPQEQGNAGTVAPPQQPAPQPQEERRSSPNLPQAYELARDRDPDRTAKVLDLSSVLSAPPDVVDRNMDKASAAATARENRPDFEALTKDAPATARHLAIPTNMAVSKDDTDNMGAVESFFKTSPYTYGFRELYRGYLQSVQGTAKVLDDAAKLAERGLLSLGVPQEYARRGGAFEDAQAAYAPPAWAPEPREFSGKLMAAVGRLPMDLGRLALLSRLPGGAATAMGLEGAVSGGADDGWKGASSGAVHGALFGGILHTFGYAPKLLQAPMAGAFGFGETYRETGDMDEALAQGLVFAGFHAPQFLQGVKDVYASSKTLARSPAVAEAHLAEVLKDAGYPDTSYLPAREVEQVFAPLLRTEGNGKLKKFLDGIGVTLPDFHEAGRLDLDLEFPTAKLVRFLSTDQGKELLDKTKWTPFADPEQARALADLREQAEAGATAREASAEGQEGGHVLDLSGAVAGDAMANPSGLLRQAGLDPKAVSRVLGPIADTPMPVADIAADPRFKAALKLLNYDDVQFGEAAKPAEPAPFPSTLDGFVEKAGQAEARPEAEPQADAYRITFAKEPVEDVTRDRAILRDYLDDIPPETIMALKDRRPDDYRAILKSIVRKMFPKGADVTFRTVDGARDYDHLLTDVTRQDYIHSLPATMKRADVTVAFRDGDVEKGYFIKKYFDPEIQKDIWDMVVLHDGELRTKIARKGGDGRRYVEGQIMRQENQASSPRTPAGAKASAATPSELPQQQVGIAGKEVKQAAKDGPVKQVFDILDPIQSRAENALPLEIALTAKEISHPDARQAALDDGRRQAVTLPGNRVILIVDRLGSPEEAVKLWVHEQGIHQGLRVFLGKNLDKWRDSLVETYGGADGLREIAAAQGIDLSTPDGLRRAAEERFATIADKKLLAEALTPEETNLWQRFVQVVRDGLRRSGVTVEFTDDEIAKLARDSLRATLGRERPAEEAPDLRPRDVMELALARETLGMERAFDDADVLAQAAKDPTLAAELKEYNWLFDEAQRRAEVAFDKEVAKERRQAEKQWRAEATDLYEQSSGWQAYKRCVEAGGLSETGLRLFYDDQVISDLKAVSARYEGFKERWRGQKLVTPENPNIGPDELAAEFGFRDATQVDDFVQFLLAQPGRQDFVDRYVDGKHMVVEDAYQAEETIATDAYERLLAKQSAIFGRLSGQKPRGTSELKRLIEEQTGVKPVMEAISEKDALVASLKRQQQAAKVAFAEGVREGQAGARAKGKEALAAERQKRLTDAFEASERLRETLARVKERARAKEEVDKALTAVQEAVDSKSVDFDFAENITALAARFGFVTARSKMPQDPHNMRPLRELLAENLPPDSLIGMVVPEKYFDPNWRPGGAARRAGTTWRDMTFDELVEFGSIIKALAQIGRTKNHAISYQSKLTFDRMADIASAFTEGHKKKVAPDDPGHYVIPERPGVLQKILDAKNDLRASLTNAEHIFRAADGWNDGNDWKGEGPFGPNYEFGFLPMVRAMERELSLSQEYNGKFKELLKPLYGKLKGYGKKKTIIKGVPGMWSRENMVMLALNCGNEGNLKTIRQGMGLSDAQIKAVTDQLTKTEWDFVTGVWDLTETLYPLLSAEYRKIYGRPLPKVERTPWETPYGTVRGGYFPIKADPRTSKKAEMFADMEDQKNSLENSWQMRFPSASMTKSRTGSVQPPRLEFDVIHNHLRESIHNISFSATMRDVYRFVQHPVVEKSMTDYVGAERYREIVPWLQSISADGRSVRPDQIKLFDRIAERIRRNATTVYMGWKATTAVVQATAMTVALGEVPAPFVLGSLRQFIMHPRESMQAAAALSVFIKARGTSFDRDIRDACQAMDVTGFRVKVGNRYVSGEDVRNAFYFFTKTMDVWTASVVFDAAYKHGLKKYSGNEVFAKDFAESVVRRTQGDGTPLSLSRIQRGTPAEKLFTMFYSYFNAIGNRMMEHTERFSEGNISGYEFGRQIAWTLIVQAIAESTMRMFMSNNKVDKDDLKNVAYNVLSYPFSVVPLARDVANPTLMQMITGKNYGYQGSPAGEAGEEALRLGVLTWKAFTGDAPDNAQEKFMRSLLMSAGYTFGLPSKQLWITYSGARDLATGKTSDPRRLLFAGKKD